MAKKKLNSHQLKILARDKIDKERKEKAKKKAKED